MKILIAEVNNTTNYYEDGAFFVTTDENDGPFKIQYVTPYLGGQDGGLIAIPEVGTRILICQPDNSEFWFYLGSTTQVGLGGSFAEPGNTIKEKSTIPDKRLYRARQKPQRYSFMSPKGNGLILSDEYNPNYFNVKAVLKSAAGKALKLIDSPLVDSVILENEHGDRIKISSKGGDSSAARSIEIDAKGPISITTREGTLNLQVIDGRELNIINKSTGSKRSGSNDPTPGNINIQSEQGDISLISNSDTGAIFIESNGSNGNIILDSKGKVSISGDKGIDITSNSGNVIVNGTEIHLN